MSNTAIFFLGIIPLFVFVLIDSFMGPKAGLIAAAVLAAAEAIGTYYYFGKLDMETAASLFLVLLLAGVSYQSGSTMFIKFQPVVLSVGLGGFLLVSSYMGHPLMLEMAQKYQSLVPEKQRMLLSHPRMIKTLVIMSHYLGWALLAHAGATAYGALKMSNWWWIAIRGIGFYLFAFIAMFAAQIQAGK